MNLRKRLHAIPQSTQSGFTLIEALLAIIVVSVMLVAIAPAIVLSVATRVQARRVEIATESAQSYIEGVRSGEIPIPAGIISATALKNINAPTAGALTCNSRAYCTAPATDLFCIDNDGSGTCTSDSLKDMIIQVSVYHHDPDGPSDTAVPTDTIEKEGFSLGMRVYRADAFTSGRTLTTGGTAASFTGGTGLKSVEAPLVKLTTDIIPEDARFSNLCTRIAGSDAAEASECNS